MFLDVPLYLYRKIALNSPILRRIFPQKDLFYLLFSPGERAPRSPNRLLQNGSIRNKHG